MGRDAQEPRQRRATRHSVAAASWVALDGIHANMPGAAPSEAELEGLTRKWQRQLRNSPLWKEMVREFGEAKAEELLSRCGAKLA